MLYKVTDEHYKSIIAGGKYRTLYEIGKVVTAIPGTLGLMFFSDPDSAKDFAYLTGGSLCKFLKVEPIEEIKTISCISLCTGERYLDWFYFINGYTSSTKPPKGTICCQSVKVIEEVFL